MMMRSFNRNFLVPWMLLVMDVYDIKLQETLSCFFSYKKPDSFHNIRQVNLNTIEKYRINVFVYDTHLFHPVVVAQDEAKRGDRFSYFILC